MMGTNPAQNFGLVLAELCTPARSSIIMVLSQAKETERMKLLIRTYICISIYHILVLKNIVFIWQSRMSNLEYKGYKNLIFTCLQNPARVQKTALQLCKCQKDCSDGNWSDMFEIFMFLLRNFLKIIVVFFLFLVEFGGTIISV